MRGRVNLRLAILGLRLYPPVGIVPFYDEAGEFYLCSFDLHEFQVDLSEGRETDLEGDDKDRSGHQSRPHPMRTFLAIERLSSSLRDA